MPVLVVGILLWASAITAYPMVVQAQASSEQTAGDEEPEYDFQIIESTPVPAQAGPEGTTSTETAPTETETEDAVPAEAAPAEAPPPAVDASAPPAQPSSETSTGDVEPGYDFKLMQMPPLPFERPEVTPVTEPGRADDVDRRTTAFTPSNLEMMTEIEMPAVGEDERWIRLDLSEQMVVVYEGTKPIRGFIVSTGLPGTPTVTGTFRIRLKVRSQTMTGGSYALGTYYSLPNVEWVQYFYADYGFHGTYWHNNFGQPMSHGCINMTNADAKWLFDWAGPKWDEATVWYSASKENPGTLVIVHE